MNDFIDPARWHVDDLGQAVLTDGQRAETEPLMTSSVDSHTAYFSSLL